MTHLIRHGDYIGQANGKLVDHGLSPLGVKQAELLRDRLAATGEIQADVLIGSVRTENTKASRKSYKSLHP